MSTFCQLPWRGHHVELCDVGHKIFLNPSTSKVMCTTSAKAQGARNEQVLC